MFLSVSLSEQLHKLNKVIIKIRASPVFIEYISIRNICLNLYSNIF